MSELPHIRAEEEKKREGRQEQPDKEFESKKREYFVRLGLEVREALKMHRDFLWEKTAEGRWKRGEDGKIEWGRGSKAAVCRNGLMKR
ncbi:MAG: hypothetical protein Q8R20_03525 [Nanoarchaeota archaeon]|nr:hypothetical protein [Nanoarchaeota archaeon]